MNLPPKGQPVATPVPDYDRDFYAWAIHNAELIRQGRLAELDLEHLAEEVESMGVSQRNELKNRIRVLLLHLLKWQFQPKARSSGWVGTIDEQRARLDLLLEESPSLRRLLDEAIDYAYPWARQSAGRETGLSVDAFPDRCPYTAEQALNTDFWPN